MTTTNPIAHGKVLADVRPRLEAAFGEAWHWWIRELGACLPVALRQRFAGRGRRLLLILDAAGDNLIEEIGDEHRLLGRIGIDDHRDRQIIARLPRMGQDERRPLSIRVDAHHALCTTASLPLAAERNLAQVIGFEFERLAPFKQNEVYFAYRVVSRDKVAQTIAIELTIVPHAALAKFVATLAGLGFQATEIQVTRPAGAVPTAISIASENRVLGNRSGHRINLGLGVIALVLAIACVAIPLWRNHKALENLGAQIADARRQAEVSVALQKQIDTESRDQRFLIDRKLASPTVTELLATLTQLLPDDTYLTELELKGNELRMVGLTGSATALLAAIAKSPSFHNPSFQSSITRDEKANRERFDIGTQITKRSGQ